MSKFRNTIGAILRGSIVVLQTVAAVVLPAKFADAATRDDGAHRDRVASDEGVRFEIDAKADAALAQSEQYVQVAQNQPRTATDVVEDSIRVLNSRGVDTGALLQAGALDEAVQGLVASGEVEGLGDGGSDGVDVEDVIEGLDLNDVQQILASS
ncbi:MAG: hypothetical protein ACMVY4_04700 [Minwuia sp.]|uniref:hypothetical protein n=1 Tax=Minwuia sp. TaxID=2493630 RepID=UPI003A8B2DA9